MKIYALNIPSEHPSLEVLRQFGDTSCVASNTFERDSFDAGAALIFLRTNDAQELKALCEQCEAQGDWCFAWISSSLMDAMTNDVSPALVDFVTSDFTSQELSLRLTRLVRLENSYVSGDYLSIPNEIASDLTKKQLVILKALFEAGEMGLSKEDISKRIWKKENSLVAKASGFNVHVLHLRRRLEPFGLAVAYDKRTQLYRLNSSAKIRKSKPQDLSH